MKVFRVTALMLCALALFSAPSMAHGATCPDGTEAITDTTRAIATYAGFAPDAPCWNPKDPHVGQAAGEAKQYLASLRPGKNSCLANPNDEIYKINDALAICAARFLKAFNDAYGVKPQINRAWNSLACEAKLCVNNDGCGGYKNDPAPKSNHTKGYAIDVSAGAKQYAMEAYAKANPQFGVCFPFYQHPRFKDDVHMILAGIPGGEPRGPGCAGVTKPCDGTVFDPTRVPDPGPPGQVPTSGVPGSTPFGNMMQGLQNYFNPPQQQCPAGYILMNGQCMPQQMQATNQITSPVSYFSSTTQPTGSSAIGTGYTSADIGSSVNISEMIDSTAKNSGSSTSAIDLIGALANPTTTSSTTGTMIPLNGSLAVRATLQGVQASNTKTLSGSAMYPGTMQVSDTFVSPDLSQTPPVRTFPAPTSTFGNIERLKQLLVSILSLLRPFGGTTPPMPANPPGTNTTVSYL